MEPATVNRIERGADARMSTWKKLYQALGYYAVLVPIANSEDAQGLLDDETYQRQLRMAEGRLRRWR